ncbi:MAG: OmpA family protein [Calditrichia bacterium]
MAVEELEEQVGGGGEEESEEPAGWITTFSDLMSLLLTFFILLFSMSTVEVTKFRQILASVQSALGVQNTPEAGTREGLEMLDHESKEPEENAVDELGGMVKAELEDIKSEVDEFVMKNKLGGSVSVKLDERGAAITISDVILFSPGDARFNSQARPILEKMIDLLNQFPYLVRVEGHTDNVPIHTEKYPSNWELSTARAAEIVRFFIRNGVDPRRLMACGFAEFRPVADNSTKEGRDRNRRVEIVYIREDIRKKMELVSGIEEPSVE